MAGDSNHDAIAAEVTGILQQLIRYKTVNPPGNETPAAEWIVGLLRSHGIEAEVLEGVPGRGNAVARLRSDSPVAQPLLLMGHLDVVGVEEEHWTRDPFGGEIEGGFIWGRGALDMKGQVAAEIVALLEAKRSGTAFDRDIILMATSDEEVGDSNCGAEWLWERHRDKIDAEFAINEGGGWLHELHGKRFFTCGVGEKGASRLRITARGPAGHASVPLPDTAMGKMARALERLNAWRAPIAMTDTVASMLRTMASALPAEYAGPLEVLLSAPTWEKVDALPVDDDMRLELTAILANTAVPTIIRGGQQINVIPSVVVADIDGRILPGQDPEAFRRQVQAAVGSEIEVVLTSDELGLEASPHSLFFEAIAETLADLQPGSTLAPLMLTGGTDAASVPGIRAHGFFPWPSPERQMFYHALMHAHDERIAITDLAFATSFYVRLIDRFCGGDKGK